MILDLAEIKKLVPVVNIHDFDYNCLSKVRKKITEYYESFLKEYVDYSETDNSSDSSWKKEYISDPLTYSFISDSLSDVESYIYNDIWNVFSSVILPEDYGMISADFYKRQLNVERECIYTQKCIVDIFNNFEKIAVQNQVDLEYQSPYSFAEAMRYSKHFLLAYLSMASLNMAAVDSNNNTMFIGFSDKERIQMFNLYNELKNEGIDKYVFSNRFMLFNQDVSFTTTTLSEDLNKFNNQTKKIQHNNNIFKLKLLGILVIIILILLGINYIQDKSLGIR